MSRAERRACGRRGHQWKGTPAFCGTCGATRSTVESEDCTCQHDMGIHTHSSRCWTCPCHRVGGAE